MHPTAPPTGAPADSCGLGHDVSRISCVDAARAIIANRGNPHRLRPAAEYVLAKLDAARAELDALYDLIDDPAPDPAARLQELRVLGADQRWRM